MALFTQTSDPLGRIDPPEPDVRGPMRGVFGAPQQFRFREGLQGSLAGLGGGAEQQLRDILGRGRVTSFFGPNHQLYSLADIGRLRRAGLLENRRRLEFLDQVLNAGRQANQAEPDPYTFNFGSAVRGNLEGLGGDAESRLRAILGGLSNTQRFKNTFADLIGASEGNALQFGRPELQMLLPLVQEARRRAFIEQVLAGAPQQQQTPTTGGGGGGGGSSGGGDSGGQKKKQRQLPAFGPALESGPFILQGGRDYGLFGSSRESMEDLIRRIFDAL